MVQVNEEYLLEKQWAEPNSGHVDKAAQATRADFGNAATPRTDHVYWPLLSPAEQAAIIAARKEGTPKPEQV